MILLILQKTHYVSIDLITIPPFVLICINLIIGLWVLSTKSHGILNKLFPFKPYGSLLYMAFAIVTMSFIGYAYLDYLSLPFLHLGVSPCIEMH